LDRGCTAQAPGGSNKLLIGLWPSETFAWILRAHRFEAPWATRVDSLQVPKCRL
jgi:hypothetical protein